MFGRSFADPMSCLIEAAALENGEILKFSGEIDFRSTPGFRSLLQDRIETQCPLLLLDMAEVDYIDSGGMSALVEYWRDAHRHGGEFALVGLNERLTEIFHLVHLDRHLRIFTTWEEAHAFFQPAGIS